MPLTPSGKINRRGLPCPRASRARTAVAPRDAIELELTRIWEEVLEVQHLDIRQDFFALGGHSLLAIRLMVLIEERMGRELPLATLFQAPTIEQLADILRQTDTGTEPTLVCLQSLGRSNPSSASQAQAARPYTSTSWPGTSVRTGPFMRSRRRGWTAASEPYSSVPRIAESYVRAMRAIQPDGPYALAGHSFGGRVAFEMTRALERMGQHVQQLILLDCSAPHPEEQGHDWDDTTLLIAFAGALGLDIAGDIDLLAGIVADQELHHKIERILYALKQRNLVLPDTRMSRVKGLFQVFNANNQMSYVPEGPIHAGITLFKARDFQPRVLDNEYFRRVIDDPVMLARIEAMNRTWVQFNERVSRTREDAHLGWDRYTSAAVTAYDVPGDHMNLVREPYVQALAEAIRVCLAG